MPPRTVADATRFTPTGPHAFTPGAPHMPSETPGERVQRLREQAQKEKAQRQAGTKWERAIDKGRRFADVAHRVTATALIASTVICGGLVIYAVTDLMMHNRKKAKEVAEYHKKVYETTAAVLLAEDEEKARAISAEFDRERKAHVEERPKGPWEKFKGWAMSGLTPAGQDIKPIFEHEEGKVLEAVQKTQEEKVKNELAAQGSASSGPVLVAVKDEEEKKSRGVMDRVKGLWGGGSK